MSGLVSMYWKARSIRPPLQALFCFEQSTSCCSEKDLRVPVERNIDPSTDPVVEKAQHDPHCPWFLTGVTAPLVLQSTSSAKLDSSRILTFFSRTNPSFGSIYPVSFFLSSAVQVENSLMVTL